MKELIYRAILSYEIGFDLEFHVVDTAILLRQSQRLFHNLILNRIAYSFVEVEKLRLYF